MKKGRLSSLVSVTGIISCAFVLSGCCYTWPQQGRGGMAEHAYNSAYILYGEMDIIELGRKIYRAKDHLDDLHSVGAGDHYPAYYDSIKNLLNRTMREYHGELYKDAELDLMIVNELMHKLDHALMDIKI